MKGKLPFMPYFGGDLQASTAEWDGLARSLYQSVLWHQWALGSLPVEPEKVRKLVDWDAKVFRAHWPTVATKFELRDGRLVNARLEEHRKTALEIGEKRAEAGRRSAEARASRAAAAAQQTDDKRSTSVATGLQHPIQSNPIHTTESLRSSSVGNLLPSESERGSDGLKNPVSELGRLGASVLKAVPHA